MTLVPVYPDGPGWKDTEISKRNAEDMARQSRVWTLRRRVRLLFKDGGFIGTPDECATQLNESFLAIRPRCSELYKMGLLERTGVRRLAAGGRSAAVLRWAGD